MRLVPYNLLWQVLVHVYRKGTNEATPCSTPRVSGSRYGNYFPRNLFVKKISKGVKIKKITLDFAQSSLHRIPVTLFSLSRTNNLLALDLNCYK
jgi:hypothetical protein